MPSKTSPSNIFVGDISTEAQSYWLGFFCADGGFHPNLKQASFQLASKDRAHLAKLATLLSIGVKDGKTTDSRTGKTYPWCKITFYGKATIAAMMSLGLPINKTSYLDGTVFDHIPEHLIHHFVRGYFDGDGCITHIGIAEYRIIIVGTEAFLQRMQETINTTPDICFMPPRKRGRLLHGITLCGTDRINNFKRWMYSDASIFMERKQKIFNAVPLHRGASRFKGVYRSHRRNCWLGRLYENGKMRTIGQFATEELAYDAIQAYKGR